MAIWKAKTEGKDRFFAWLLVQRKILTADKLLARNWPCNPMCPLCDQEDETGGIYVCNAFLLRKYGYWWRHGVITL
jgi:hypothetical protein